MTPSPHVAAAAVLAAAERLVGTRLHTVEQVARALQALHGAVADRGGRHAHGADLVDIVREYTASLLLTIPNHRAAPSRPQQ